MYKEVETYLASASEQRRGRLEILHNLIIGQFPEAVVDMEYRMPTYHVANGWVAIANQKNYISLYTCGYHHIEAFKRKHPDIKTGKGCINFKDKDELPVGEIAAVVKHAIEHPKGD
jgi:uncharacterized protein YdhG (YjbR/CyaY superfamily)